MLAPCFDSVLVDCRWLGLPHQNVVFVVARPVKSRRVTVHHTKFISLARHVVAFEADLPARGSREVDYRERQEMNLPAVGDRHHPLARRWIEQSAEKCGQVRFVAHVNAVRSPRASLARWRCLTVLAPEQ